MKIALKIVLTTCGGFPPTPHQRKKIPYSLPTLCSAAILHNVGYITALACAAGVGRLTGEVMGLLI